MKILMQTTYYYPHVSGLTIFFQRLAESLARQEHEVTVVTSQHDQKLPRTEKINGVSVLRTQILFRINKGVFLPKILFDSFGYLRKADVLHVNLPSLEALPLVIAARLLGKKVVTTYNCDLVLPEFFLSKIFDFLIDIVHFLTLLFSSKITCFTSDFCENSRVLKYFKNQVIQIYPQTSLNTGIKKFSDLAKLKRDTNSPIIGMATRVAADKGIDDLVNALILLRKKFPEIILVIAGNKNALGEEKYLNYLEKLIKLKKIPVYFLGNLTPEKLRYFYMNIDALVIASISRNENFSIVQVEAMLEGTPIVVTNLPGLRVPVKITKMGEIAQAANPDDLAEKILTVITNKKKYVKPLNKIKKIFDDKEVVEKYLKIYSH